MAKSHASIAGDIAASIISGAAMPADFTDRLSGLMPGVAALSVALATKDGSSLLLFPVGLTPAPAGAAACAATATPSPPIPPRPAARAGAGTASWMAFQAVEPLRSEDHGESTRYAFADWVAMRRDVAIADAAACGGAGVHSFPLVLCTFPLEARGGVLGAVTVAARPVLLPAATVHGPGHEEGGALDAKPAATTGGRWAFPAADGLAALAAALGPCLALARADADLALLAPRGASSKAPPAAAAPPAVGNDAACCSASAAAPAPAPPLPSFSYETFAAARRARWDGARLALLATGAAWWAATHCCSGGGGGGASSSQWTDRAAAGSVALLPLLPALPVAAARWAAAASPAASDWYAARRDALAALPRAVAGLLALASSAWVDCGGPGGGPGGGGPAPAPHRAAAWLAAYAFFLPARFPALAVHQAAAAALVAAVAGSSAGALSDAGVIFGVGCVAPLLAVAVVEEALRDAYDARGAPLL